MDLANLKIVVDTKDLARATIELNKFAGDVTQAEARMAKARKTATDVHTETANRWISENRDIIATNRMVATAAREESLAVAGMDMAARRAAESKGILAKYSHQFMRTLVDLTPIISGLGLLTLAHGAIQATDAYTKLTSQLKTATNSTSEYAFAMSEVKRISSAAQVDINAIGSLYQRLSLATQASGTSQKEVALITETVSLGLKANGATARESASAMLQLSQSFGSGRMAGEEFNSMAEAAPNVLRALATSMGVPYGALKQLASEGKITTEVMVKAFTDPALLASFQEQAKSMRTITGSWVELTNALVFYVGEGSKSSGVTKVLSGALTLVADNVKLIGNTLILVASILALRFAGALIITTAETILLTRSQISLIASMTGVGIASAAATTGLRAATVAARGFQLALGPIGWISLLLGAGATAWMMWGDEAEKAGNKAEDALKKTNKAIDMTAWDKLRDQYKTEAYIVEEKEKNKQTILEESYKKQSEMGMSYQESSIRILEINAKRRENIFSGHTDSVKKEFESYYKSQIDAEVLNQERQLAAIKNTQTQAAGMLAANKDKGTKEPKLSDSQSAMNAVYDKAINQIENLTKKTQDLTASEIVSMGIKDGVAKKQEHVTRTMAEAAVQKGLDLQKEVEKQAAEEKSIKSMNDRTASIIKETNALTIKTHQIGMSKEAIAVDNAARTQQQLTSLEGIQLLLKETDATEGLMNVNLTYAASGVEAIAGLSNEQRKSAREWIVHLKEMQIAQEEFAKKSVIQKMIEENKKHNEELQRTLEAPFKNFFSDILNGSKNTWINMRDSFKKIFIDFLYEMTAKKWIINTLIGTTGMGAITQAGASTVGAVAGTGIAGAIGTSAATTVPFLGAGVIGGAAATTTAGTGLIGGFEAGGISGAFAASPLLTVAAGAAAAYVIAKYGFGWGNSREYSAQRMEGTVGASGVNARMASDWKKDGGWFGKSSSGTDYSVMTKAVENKLKYTAEGARQIFIEYGKSIGDATIASKNFNVDVNDIANGLGKQLVPALEEFRMEGETLVDTAKRMTAAISNTNNFVKSLELTAIEQFKAAVSAKNAMRDMAESIRDFAKTLRPQGTSALRSNFFGVNALAAGGDVNAQGKLQQSATDYLTSAKSGARSYIDYMQSVSTVQNALEKTAGTIGKRATTAELQLAEMKASNAYLKDIDLGVKGGNLVSNVMKEVMSDNKMTLEEANTLSRAVGADVALGNLTAAQGNTISTAISNATADGVITADETKRINDAIKTATIDTSTYSSETSGFTSDTNNSINALNRSIIALMRSADVAASVSALTSSVGAAKFDASKMTQVIDPISGAIASSYATDRYNTTTATTLGGETTVSSSVNTALMTSDANRIMRNIVHSLLTSKQNEVDTWMYEGDARGAIRNSIISDHVNAWNTQHNSEVAALQAQYDALPAFALGTNVVPFDMNARIHAGEEIKPRQFVDKDRSDREETNKILNELKAQVIELKAAQIATTFNTHKTAKILDRFDGIGIDIREAA